MDLTEDAPSTNGVLRIVLIIGTPLAVVAAAFACYFVRAARKPPTNVTAKPVEAIVEAHAGSVTVESATTIELDSVV